jgi:hypothetical protein
VKVGRSGGPQITVKVHVENYNRKGDIAKQIREEVDKAFEEWTDAIDSEDSDDFDMVH